MAIIAVTYGPKTREFLLEISLMLTFSDFYFPMGVLSMISDITVLSVRYNPCRSPELFPKPEDVPTVNQLSDAGSSAHHMLMGATLCRGLHDLDLFNSAFYFSVYV